MCWLLLLLLDRYLLPKTEHRKVSFKKGIKGGAKLTHGETVLNNIRTKSKDDLLEDAQKTVQRKKICTFAAEQKEFKKNHQDRRDLRILTEDKKQVSS